jgi:hypothetical protein
MGPVGGSCEYRNEPSSYMKSEIFLDQMKEFRFSRRALPYRVR